VRPLESKGLSDSVSIFGWNRVLSLSTTIIPQIQHVVTKRESDLEKLVAMSTLGAATIAALHWMPWGKLLGNELRPPKTYIVGVAVIGATFSAWAAWAQPQWGWAIGGFWIITAAIGTGDVIAYFLDRLGGDAMKGRTHGRPPTRGDARD